ncbi:MAG TPA: efflux RND transporter periplasmic adaptor subunit [Methylocystis sp.]|nr:efflux RND transporter periplasmic adaptor subunit [Methylocystis sp.]
MDVAGKRIFASRRRAFIGLLSVLALVGAYLAWGFVTAAPRTRYATVRVERGDIEKSVLATGILQGIQQVDVGTRVSGQLKSLHVKLGDHVRAGDLLAEIDPIVPENELRAAQANLANLEAQKRSALAKLRRSRVEYERQRGMIRGDVTSRKDLEVAEEQSLVDAANVAALEAQIAQSKSQADIASANLSYTKITAPIEGDVVGILTQEGQTVVATQIVPIILKLARLDAMKIKTQVSEADILDVKPGQTARFTVMGDADRHFSGVLRTVELAPQSYSEPPPSPGQQQGAAASGAGAAVFYNAWFDVRNDERMLRVGMTAQVSIVTSTARGALIIPAAVLSGQGDGGRSVVRVIGRNGRAEPREIKIGINNRVKVQVLEGLREGDEVVTKDLDDSRGGGGP